MDVVQAILALGLYTSLLLPFSFPSHLCAITCIILKYLLCYLKYAGERKTVQIEAKNTKIKILLLPFQQ